MPPKSLYLLSPPILLSLPPLSLSSKSSPRSPLAAVTGHHQQQFQRRCRRVNCELRHNKIANQPKLFILIVAVAVEPTSNFVLHHCYQWNTGSPPPLSSMVHRHTSVDLAKFGEIIVIGVHARRLLRRWPHFRWVWVDFCPRSHHIRRTYAAAVDLHSFRNIHQRGRKLISMVRAAVAMSIGEHPWYARDTKGEKNKRKKGLWIIER